MVWKIIQKCLNLDGNFVFGQRDFINFDEQFLRFRKLINNLKFWKIN